MKYKYVILSIVFLLSSCVHAPRKNEQIQKRSVIVAPSEPDGARRLFQEKINYLQSLYKVRHDPYFGTADKDEDCLKDLDLKGHKTDNKMVEAISFNLNATENFIFGVCDKTQNIYRSELTYANCKQKGLIIEIKSFWPIQQVRPPSLSIEEECQNASL